MKTDNEGFAEDHTNWNMAVAWLMRLNDNCRNAELARGEGDLVKWYRSLSTLISQIHWKIKEAGNEEEEKEMYDSLNKVRVEFNRMRGKPQSMIKESLTDLEIQLEILHEQINDLLHDYDFLGMQRKAFVPGSAVEEAY